MCGQFLCVGDLFKAQDNFIADMFVMDSLRGTDSCGLVAVNNYDDGVQVVKRAILPYDFLDLTSVNKIIADKNKVLMGHNRWATKGSLSSVNAHPFSHGNIHGMHNGTLTYQEALVDSHKFEVDSENIMYSINKIGIDHTWKSIHGAAALLWYDEEAETVNMLRNKERPFYFCYSKDLKQMYGASEKFMLMAALERNHIRYHQLEELPVNKLYSFKVQVNARDARDVVKCTVRDIEPAKPISHSCVSYGNKATTGNTQKALQTPGGKKVGQRVDFMVVTKTLGSYSDTYDVVDNETDDYYVVEVFNKFLDLEEGDCATSTILDIKKYEITLAATQIRFDSEYESVEEGEVVEEEGTVVPPLTQEQWASMKSHDCSWCSSPVSEDEDYLYSEQGDLFCSECKQLQEVAEYVTA